MHKKYMLMLMAGLVGLVMNLSSAAENGAGMKLENLRCEYLVDPIGIDQTHPRLSWELTADARGVKQSAYQIQVATSEAAFANGTADLWDSGVVQSNETNQIAYAGKPLTSRTSCVWRVKVWDQENHPSEWSSVAKWEMGLLSQGDWHASWISDTATGGKLQITSASYESVDGEIKKDVTDAVKKKVRRGSLSLKVNNDNLGGDPAKDKHKHLIVNFTFNGKDGTIDVAEQAMASVPEEPVPAFRRAFAVNKPVKRARLYITARGLYHAEINGQMVGDHILAPDWTDYRKRIQYQAYDVTPMIKSGENAIGVQISNGWYAGHIGNGGFQFWGTQPSFISQLEITYDDGSSERISSDKQWRAHGSAIVSSDFMMGEIYDAQKEITDWSKPGLDAGDWQQASEVEAATVPLEAQSGVPVRKLMELQPKEVKEPSPGHYVYDMGQNMVGVIRLKVTASAGTKVTIRHAEMLKEDGTMYTDNYRGAPSIDNYTCKGGGEEIWTPTFTFHGFRYVELTGLPDKPGIDAVTGVVIGSDTPKTGEFSCSDPRINQLQSNIVWGQRGNFVSVPTDCPQRDERLGWMGDAEVFIGTAVYNADVSAFFTKWLVDVDDAQKKDGRYTDVSPETMRNAGGVPGWADAGVICPWTIYTTYGDKRQLEDHFPNMVRFVNWCKAHSDGLIRKKDRGSDYGDWLSIGANTPKDLLGTAYFAYSTHLVAESAKALGKQKEAKEYSDLFDQIKAAFVNEYVAADGKMTNDTQADYALALRFGLLDDSQKATAAQLLEENIKAKDNHLSTGFLGVSHLLYALSDNGKLDTAYRLLLQDTFPSWLFSVKHGATTIWERWDGWTPEKGFQDAGMNSFNHYSLGSCGQWLFNTVAGIGQANDSTGYRHIIIRPRIGPGLTSATGQYRSIRGLIQSAWKVQDGQTTLDVTIPANCDATIFVPTQSPDSVMEGRKPADQSDGLKRLRIEGDAVIYQAGSGSYSFTAK